MKILASVEGVASLLKAIMGHETSQVRKELSSDSKELDSFVGLMEAVTQASNETLGMVLTDARRCQFNKMFRSQEIVLTSKLRNLQVEEEAWLSLKTTFMNKDLFRSSSIHVVERSEELRKDDQEVDEDNFEFDDKLEKEERDRVSAAVSGDAATLVGQSAMGERRVQALALGLDQIGRSVRCMHKSVREASAIESALSAVNTSAQFRDAAAFPAVGDSRSIIRAIIS